MLGNTWYTLVKCNTGTRKILRTHYLVLVRITSNYTGRAYSSRARSCRCWCSTRRKENSERVTTPPPPHCFCYMKELYYCCTALTFATRSRMAIRGDTIHPWFKEYSTYSVYGNANALHPLYLPCLHVLLALSLFSSSFLAVLRFCCRPGSNGGWAICVAADAIPPVPFPTTPDSQCAPMN